MVAEQRLEGDGGQGEPERLTLRQIFGLLAGGWRIIMMTTVICVLVALLVGLFGTRLYKTYYIAIPAQTSESPLSAHSLSLDILGRPTKSTRWTLYLSLLTSTRLAQRIVTQTNILQRLLPQQWDAKRKRWITNKSSFRSRSMLGKLKWLLGDRTPPRVPDKFSLQGYLLANLHISDIPETSEVEVSINSPNPSVSLALLTKLHNESNSIISDSRLARAERERAYLLRELKTTTVADYRQALLGILGRVENTIMTAGASDQYAAILVDGPVTKPYPIFPRKSLLLKLALVFGITLGMVLVVFLPLNDEKLCIAWSGAIAFGRALFGKFRG